MQAAAKNRRKEVWKALDANGNGMCSLAEVDGWILKYMQGQFSASVAEEVWKCFRPSYIRAFKDAKDLIPGKPAKGKKPKSPKRGKANRDDYVTKGEFRGLCAMLCIYARMYDAFALIDGGGAGVNADDDRKMTLAEWKAGRNKVKNFGFVALKNPKNMYAADQFAEMNSGYTGMKTKAKDDVVMLSEFCQWVKEGERGTKLGELLFAGES